MINGQFLWTNINNEQSFSIYSKYHLFIFIVLIVKVTYSADLDIKIPGNLSQRDSRYRLDYYPPHGNPPANKTISASKIGDVIKFRDGLPGTKYEFLLYYSNETLNDWLTWAASIVTAPDPPSNLNVEVHNGKNATVHWTPPYEGLYTNYSMRVSSFNDVSYLIPTFYTIPANAVSYTLNKLIPGATYSIQLFTLLGDKESVAYANRNFTTKPNTPGKFIVWFRNETTLLVLWQPPYPADIYSHYQVSIDPSDATESVSFVEKEGEPPGPAQAAFKDLVPGRAYNIAVQTVSEDEISAPTTAQYRTVPLRPLNVTFDKSFITSTSFRVFWLPPNGSSEFDKYQISLGNKRGFSPITINRNNEQVNSLEFKDLDPGKTYQVVVKTVSGKVTSWPTSGDVTLKPLPVKDLQASIDEKMLKVSWRPDNKSIQNSFKVEYHEVDVSSSTVISSDSNSTITNETTILLDALLPGRNYTITVQAISNGVESNETRIFQVTRPSSPIIQDLKSIEKGLNISWKSDVNSRQEKFEITHTRNDTGESATTLTTESHIILEYLYPGAGYEIKVFAISHGLKSEPHDYFQAVLPHPPQQLRIIQLPYLSNNNTIGLSWLAPSTSLVSEYSIKHRTEDNLTWKKIQPSPKITQSQISYLEAGEKHTIQVNSVSFGVESLFPLQVNYTVAPNPVVNITPIVDSTNITLEFDCPEGRIEYFVVKWWPIDFPDSWKLKNMTKEDSEDDEFSREKVVRFLIDDLVPGIKYTFSILTVSYHLMSNESEITVRTMPLISSELLIITNHEDIDSLTVKCTPTPVTYSRFNLYRFQINDDANTTMIKLANGSDIKVTFNSLVPGKLYNITAWTVSADVLSKPLFKQVRLYPETVNNISAEDINGTSISLIWEPPRGEFDAFEVQFLHNDKLISNVTNTNRVVISDLRPFKNYTFTVIVHSGFWDSIYSTKSGPISASFITAETIPGRVEKFQPIDVLPNEVTFEWYLSSSEYNGIIDKFSVIYGLDGDSEEYEKDFKSNELTGTIRNLLPGQNYHFKIRAHTKVGAGVETNYKLRMPILAPPKPPTQVVPTEVCRTTHTIQIRFRKNYFSDLHGTVISYTIIVAEDDSKNASGLEMLSWRDVQAYSIWPPYQVLDPYYPFKNSSVEDFTIGIENCDSKTSGYCNGPLKPGSTYRVKVRAFTAPDKFTDTSFSFPIQTDKDNTAIIVGITVPIVLLLTVLGIGLLVRKNRNQLRKMTEPRSNGPTDNLSLPDSVIETSRPIRVDNFAEHYRIMSADSDFRFSEEFEELKHVGRDQPCTAADLPCNRPKNRFTNILPYDHSRFKLQPVDDEEGSDYINANYVPGHNSPREFIVTQGPLHSTRDDFWRMVWESNSRAIVMLTRCIEKGREKCDHYWPMDTHPVYYGDICVTILNETRYPDWSIMEFMLCRGDVKRVIQHFHFTTWPDFGVPNPPQTLARFVRAFRERVRPDQRPIVVHCSAGVGRSGTFITLDRILQQIQVSDYVDIFGIVWIMRKERVWMVQTEQQYICIHQCLLAVLEGQHQDTTGSPREIHDNQGFEDDEGIAESGM